MSEPQSDLATRSRAYAAEVAEALADLPPAQRAALVDGLAAHLMETNDDGVALLDLQGRPRDYAADLRATLQDAAEPPRSTRKRTMWITLVAASVAALVAAFVALPHVWGGHANTPPPSQSTSAAVTVPNVMGMGVAMAQSLLTAAGLATGTVTATASTQPTGTVVDTEPLPGSRVPPNTAVNLVVSNGPA